ncbi:hypothetical protein [Burkholderia sp. Ac-20353]|uniref:hypothetical protein n=1 Tax=Burkholderia sp. Ac-20353 TaxID=2703894 RepID=UPI00197C75EA|nr:hypothetical protein [Burkholderia sp. Ac-20353]MBN3785393.1 hypothetical protein [Burkholderia sp. Ac-20353]
MTTQSNDAIGPLLNALEADDESCWPLYEEVGRVAVAQLLSTDRQAMIEIVRAWIVSNDALGALADAYPDVRPDEPAHADAELRAQAADTALFARIRRTLFGGDIAR